LNLNIDVSLYTIISIIYRIKVAGEWASCLVNHSVNNNSPVPIPYIYDVRDQAKLVIRIGTRRQTLRNIKQYKNYYYYYYYYNIAITSSWGFGSMGLGRNRTVMNHRRNIFVRQLESVRGIRMADDCRTSLWLHIQ